MVRKKPHEEKRRAIINFKLYFPIEKVPVSFSISTTQRIKDRFEQALEVLSEKKGRHIDASEVMRKGVFKKIGITNEQNFLSKNKVVRDKVGEIRDYIIDSWQIYKGDVSIHAEQIILEAIKKAESIQKQLNPLPIR